MKTCSRCQKHKSISEFYANKSSKDGFANYCKSCVSIYNKEFTSEMRVCALPECCSVFESKRPKTMFCSYGCHDKAKKQGLKTSIITLDNSPSKWPERAFVGADDVCVVF